MSGKSINYPLFALCLVQMVWLQSSVFARSEKVHSGAIRGEHTQIPPLKVAENSQPASDFGHVYLKSKGLTSESESLLKSARDDEAAENNVSACAKYLAAASEALDAGNVKISKPIIDKISLLGAKLDLTSKKALIAALLEAGEATQRQSRILTSEYLLTAALQLKEQTAETDMQLVTTVVRLASVRGFESQYVPAETLYKRAIGLLESGKVVDEALLFRSLSSLAALSAQRGLYAEASIVLQKLLARIEKNNKPPGLDTCAYLVQFSNTQRRLGKLNEARARMTAALDIASRLTASLPPSFDKAQVIALAEGFHEAVRTRISGSRAVADEQVEKVLKMALRLRLTAGGLDESVEHELGEACQYLEKFGKAGDAADLYAQALKSTIVDEESRKRVRADYLECLKSCNRLAEAARIEAELDREDELRWKAAEGIAEEALAKARTSKTDPARYIPKLIALVKVRLSAHKIAEAMALAREVIAVGQKNADGELDDDTVLVLWDCARSYLSSDAKSAGGKVGPGANQNNSETKKPDTVIDEHFIYDVASLDEKNAGQRTELGRITDLSEITSHFTKSSRFADAAEFMKYVLALRKRFRPQDLVAASQAYEVLAEIYREAGDREKYKEARKQFLSIMESRYSHTDPRTIRPRLVVVVLKIQEGKLDEAQAIMNQVIATAEKAESESSHRPDVLAQIRRMVGMYLANYQIVEADRILQKGMALSRGSTEPDWIRIYRDRIIDYYCRGAEYEKAEELCKLYVAAVSKKAADPEDLIRARTRLSDILLFHSNSLQKHDKSADAKRVLGQSDQEFAQAIALLQKSQGGIPVQAAQRRRSALLDSGSIIRPTTARESLGPDVRHHLLDVPNQLVPSPREPLSFAVFGRSEVLLSGNASTWSCSSEVPDMLTILDSGGDVGSFGKIKLKDDAAAHGSLMARSLYMLQNNVNLGDSLNATGNAPRPYPLPPPLNLPPGLKAVRASIKRGVMTPAPPGYVVDVGELLLDCGTVLSLPPGDYIASKITLLGGSGLEISNPESNSPSAAKGVRFFFREMPVSPEGKQPVQVYVDGGSSINSKGLPAQFQLWYSGAGVLAAKDGALIHGIIYAPKALVTFSGERTCMFGSVVADEVRLSGDARAIFDKQLPNAKALGLPRLSVRPLNNQPVLTQENAGAIMMGVDPDDEELSRGDALMGLGQQPLALEHYLKAVAQFPSATSLTALAHCRIALKQHQDALNDCNRAISIAPDDAHSYATRGEVYAALNLNDQAQGDFKKAMQLLSLPESYTEVLTAGICQLGLGETEKSIALLSECIFMQADVCQAYEYRARAYEKQGKAELANQDRQRLKDVMIAQQQKAAKPQQ